MAPENETDAGLPDRKRPAHLPGIERHNRAAIFFVTACTKGRRPVLARAAVQRLLVEAWTAADHFNVGRYIIMPDHIHLFCEPAIWPPRQLAAWVAYWKSIVARRWPEPLSGSLWQRDFWDTQLRQGEGYTLKWNYVRENPVRAGLVEDASSWPFQGEMHVLRWHD